MRTESQSPRLESSALRVCELIGFCKNEQPQLFDFVEAKIAKSDVFSIFSQPPLSTKMREATGAEKLRTHHSGLSTDMRQE
ncbi:MAG: hypothetical protein Q8S00_24345 [Deltaproteobacteria bacterium]|nr:hypothetical protein [Deltaproteobacteria bacterium]